MSFENKYEIKNTLKKMKDVMNAKIIHTLFVCNRLKIPTYANALGTANM